MNVIRHQAVAKQRDAVALRAFAESFEIETPVVVEQEDVLAIVAPLRDVMRHTRHHPGHTGHSVNEELLLSHSSGAVPNPPPVRELSPTRPTRPNPPNPPSPTRPNPTVPNPTNPTTVRELSPTPTQPPWVADITYIRLRREFVCLAVLLDAYSRRVIGWALGRTWEAKLTLSALRMALRQRRPAAGLVHHSDRGVQYACGAYTDLLKQHTISSSM